MHIALTGAASGIGAATLKQLTGLGHSVTVFDIQEPPDADDWIQVDMADLGAVSAAADAADGPFDALILNAGLPPRAGNQATLLAVNVLGLRAFAEAMLPKLADGASIVATASRAGDHWRENLDEVKSLLALRDPGALPDFVAAREMDPLRAYCLSKEAVMVWALSQTEALLKRNMRINCVCPSAVDTPILADFMAVLKERAEQAISRVGRTGTPDEIAALIVFLTSRASGWLRGQHIYVDGGVSAMGLAEELGLDSVQT